MITCSNDGKIIVDVNGKRYDLSVSEQYAEFLMWITTPNANTSINKVAFDVSPDVPEEQQPKAKRYSEFLTDFIQRRSDKLGEISQQLATEQREAEINAFIERLKTGAA